MFALGVLADVTSEGRWVNAERKYSELKPFQFLYGPGTIPMPTGTPIFFKHTEKDGSERHTLIPIDPVYAAVTQTIPRPGLSAP